MKEEKSNLRIRGLFPSPSFFTCGFPCRLRLSFQHVPSHTGLKWNDVADEDAKSLLDGEPASGLNLNLVHASLGLFTGTTLPLSFTCCLRELPQVVTLDANCGSRSLVALHPPRSRWLMRTRDVSFVRLPLPLSRVPLRSCMLQWIDQGEDGDFTWWDQTLSILRAVFATFRNCVVLIDANARLGSIRSSSVGACNPEPQSPNGNHFHSLLGALSLKAVNTFADSPPTWKKSQD